uniref:Uncharacterized protein n=1 Tax=Ananas comosus var. bracteatus TaxID=296719 RepID=A0A6V7QSZ9_ANACO
MPLGGGGGGGGGGLTEDGVGGVHGDLVLRGVADEALGVGEGDIGRGGAIPLVVGDDLHAIVLPHPHARVGGAEVDPDRRSSPLPLLAMDLKTQKKLIATKKTKLQ